MQSDQYVSTIVNVGENIRILPICRIYTYVVIQFFPWFEFYFPLF